LSLSFIVPAAVKRSPGSNQVPSRSGPFLSTKGRCLPWPGRAVKRRKTMEKKNVNLDVSVEPVTDEILETVLGGLGDEDGISNSCSTERCSNTTKLS